MDTPLLLLRLHPSQRIRGSAVAKAQGKHNDHNPGQAEKR
jgi:hypothetical protein